MPSYIVVVGRWTNRVALTNSPPGTSVLRIGAVCSGERGRCSVYGSTRTYATQDDAVEAFATFMLAQADQAMLDVWRAVEVGSREVKRYE